MQQSGNMLITIYILIQSTIDYLIKNIFLVKY